MSNMPVLLPENIVRQITDFISSKADFLGLDLSSNVPLGTKVFDILGKQCTVVYFPIEQIDEENDAFLLTDIPMRSGELRNIVFINTFQTSEKQVFAAAHELGHLLNINAVIKTPDGVDDEEFNERLVNRFAAELLMPKIQFCDFIINTFNKFDQEKFSFRSLLELVVETMNYFSVPYNSVVIRLVELKIITEPQGRLLVDGTEELPINVLKTIVKTIISESDYENLQSRNMKKEIAGLSDLLEKAEQKDTVSQVQIDRLRDLFNIPHDSQQAFLDKPLELPIERG